MVRLILDLVVKMSQDSQTIIFLGYYIFIDRLTYD